MNITFKAKYKIKKMFNIATLQTINHYQNKEQIMQ